MERRLLMLARWQERSFERKLRKATRGSPVYTILLSNLKNPMVLELLRIGTSSGFLTRDGREDRRTREIGSQLNEIGGMDAMFSVYEVIRYVLPREARSLERAWNGIGDWLG